jgi:hypothetical protein
MGVGLRIDELSVHANVIGHAFHASFQDVSYTELLPDLAKITHYTTLVLHHACAADDLQIGDPCQMGEDFILHAISEEGVIGITA